VPDSFYSCGSITSGGSRIPPLANPRQPALSSALLAATRLTSAAAALLLALALLAFTFLSLKISLLAALFSWTVGLTRFVWVMLCFHNTFRLLLASTGPSAVCDETLSACKSPWKGCLDWTISQEPSVPPL